MVNDLLLSLSNEELVEQYQKTRKDDLFSAILLKNEGIIRMSIYDYRNIPNRDECDLISDGYLALFKAVNNFDPVKQVAFTTFLKVTLTQQFNRLYDEATRHKRYNGSTSISYEELVDLQRDGGCEVDTRFSIECKEYSTLEVNEFFDSISGTVKEVAVMLYRGMTKGEVAKALQVAPATVTYHIRRLQSAYISFFGVEV